MEAMIGQIFKEFPFWLATVTVIFLGILLIIWLLLPLWVLFIQWNTGKMKDESEAPRPKGLGFPVRCFLYIVPLPPPSRAGLAGHGQVGWMPRLPAAGAGRKADSVIISYLHFPEAPPCGRGASLSGRRLAGLIEKKDRHEKKQESSELKP